ncbi:MAG: galactokinase [Marmoricola sp.]
MPQATTHEAAAARSGTWAAPGRVNLIGEHTDYNDGFVLPIALEQTTRATVTLLEDGEDLRYRSEAGEVGREYVQGVVDAFRAAGHAVPGLEVSVESDVPIGAGLSSSAALECSVALALDELLGTGLSREDLAALAQRAENDFVGVPTGGMDQRASLLCTAGHALLLDCRDGATEQVPFDLAPEGLVLVVIDTRVHHALGDGQYSRRREECERAARALGVDSLRDAAPEAVERLDDDLLRRRARHVVTENARVLDVVERLRGGRLRAIGPVLTASHASMRDDYEISAPELDLAVETAVTAGALGARMTGGGFGGSAIALAEDVDAVRAAVTAAFAIAGHRPPDVFPVLPGPGGQRVG